jgi:hypothetical protein
VDKVAQTLPPEHREIVDSLKKHADNGDVKAILKVAQDALNRTAELLDQKQEEVTENE